MLAKIEEVSRKIEERKAEVGGFDDSESSKPPKPRSGPKGGRPKGSGRKKQATTREVAEELGVAHSTVVQTGESNVVTLETRFIHYIIMNNPRFWG